MKPTTCLRVPFAGRSAAARGLNFPHQFTLGRSLDYPAYVVDGDGQSIRAVSMVRQVTIPSVLGEVPVQEYLAALADVWGQNHALDPQPTYLYVDFGDDAPPGLAVLIPSKEGLETLRMVGATTVSITDVMGPV